MLCRVRLSTPWMFLLGSRRAVLDAAAGWRAALLVGALLVLSAGLARNYDGEDLRSEPWWLLGPFAASVLTSLALFGLYKFLAWTKGTTLPTRLYVPFLGLYWLTAPLAWLYGVPYEKFLSPVGAVWANAATLAVVAAWRVLLMARVAQVLLGSSFLAAVVIDLWFGIAAIWLASLLGPKPVLDVMGGLRLSEVENARADLVFGTIFWGFLALIVMSIPALLAAKLMKLPMLADVTRFGVAFRPGLARGRRGWAAASIAALAVLAWAPALAVEQPRQRIAWQVERALDEQRFSDAAALLADASRDRLPAGWRIPLNKKDDDGNTRLDGLLLAVAESPIVLPAWLRRELVDAAGDRLRIWGPWPPSQTWAEMLAAFEAPWIESLPHDWHLRNIRYLRWISTQADVLTNAEREALARGLGMMERSPPDPPAP